MVMGIAIVLGLVGTPLSANSAYVWALELVVENAWMWGTVLHAAFVRR